MLYNAKRHTLKGVSAISKPIRAFLALDIPPQVKTALHQQIDALRAHTPSWAVRWVRPEAMHLTLKFLGDVTELDGLRHTLRAATLSPAPIPLAARHLGCFPTPKRPRVIWAGVEDAQGALSAAHLALEHALAPQFPPDDKPFRPHLTLGRVKTQAAKPQRALGALIQDAPRQHYGTWEAPALLLMQSVLHPDGARYRVLDQFDFASL